MEKPSKANQAIADALDAELCRLGSGFSAVARRGSGVFVVGSLADVTQYNEVAKSGLVDLLGLAADGAGDSTVQQIILGWRQGSEDGASAWRDVNDYGDGRREPDYKSVFESALEWATNIDPGIDRIVALKAYLEGFEYGVADERSYAFSYEERFRY